MGLPRESAVRHPPAAAPPRPVAWGWHVAALAVPLVTAPVVMRGWFGDLLPEGDFAGYAAEVAYVRDTLLHHGRLPLWLSDRFAGSTWFISSMKELATFPLAWVFGTVLGTKLMFLVSRVAAAVAMYAIFACVFGAPAAGILTGEAYAFSSIANHQIALGGHLDNALSYVLFPIIFLACVQALRRPRILPAAMLGALVGTEFSLPDTHVQTLICLVMVLLLLALRPWRAGAEAREPEPASPRQWLLQLVVAFATFTLVAASQLAWLAADLRNHGLHGAETVEVGLERYSELSPFMYVNRQNWLGPWLADHRPESLILANDPLFDERRYLGLVALAVCVGGWLLARRGSLRRWYQAFTLLFVVQYWLSAGPRTFTWQLGRTFHWPEPADGPLRIGLTVAAFGVLAWASLLVVVRRRSSGQGPPAARVELALGLALLLLVLSHSLFDLLRSALPVLGRLRSPGHYFDLAPFSFFGLFGVALVAGERALSGRRVRSVAAAALAVLLAWDYWPSTAAFARGMPMEALRRIERTVARLPSEDGTLRIAMLPGLYLPGASLAGTTARSALAWTWLDWWAAKHWRTFMAGAMAWTSPAVPPAVRAQARSIGVTLSHIGRLKYAIDERPPHPHFEAPWRPVLADDDFALWEQPEVGPMAAGYRSYALLAGDNDWNHVQAITTAFARSALVVADARPDELTPAGILDTDDPTFEGKWSALLGGLVSEPTVPVTYRRPAPERVLLETDAGAAPALILLSEAHHPWWRATVDGRPARVVRAELALMAVGVGPGRHVIELRLRRPLLVAVADWVTAATWVALAVGMLVYVAAALRGRGRGWLS